MLQRKEKLARLVQFGVEISQIADLDLLLEKILSEARYLINSDAGSIYIKEGDELNFSYAQNETFQQKLEPGKKLIYTHMEMPLTAISDFRELGRNNPLFQDLADICERHDGLWSVEAEDLLLKYCG